MNFIVDSFMQKMIRNFIFFLLLYIIFGKTNIMKTIKIGPSYVNDAERHPFPTLQIGRDHLTMCYFVSKINIRNLEIKQFYTYVLSFIILTVIQIHSISLMFDSSSKTIKILYNLTVFDKLSNDKII